MSTDFCVHFLLCDLVKVLTHAVHEFPLCLSHVLGLTPSALDAVYEVGTFARDIGFGDIGPSRGLGNNVAPPPPPPRIRRVQYLQELV